LADRDRLSFDLLRPPRFGLGMKVIGAGYSPANIPVLSTFILKASYSYCC